VKETGSISKEHGDNEKRGRTFSSPQLTRLEAQFVSLLPTTRLQADPHESEVSQHRVFNP